MKKPKIVATLINFIKRENLHRIFLILLILVIVSTVALAVFEPKLTLINAMWLSVVTLTTVGYGDITPTTIAGRIIGVIIMMFGIGILGMFTASVASFFVEKKLKEDRGMKSIDCKNHIIICTWNQSTKDILHELRSDSRTVMKPIVLIANLELKPIEDDKVYFINGEANEENLNRANISEAETVIVLGDDRLEADNRDAKVVLTTLTIETMNPDIYSIVQLEKESNARHCERAKADEIIIRSEFSSRLISRSALDHGITKVISSFLSSREGDEILKIPVPEKLAGNDFLHVFTQMKSNENMIVLAIQHEANGEVITNPSNELLVDTSDTLLVISKSRTIQ
jgi:voltage-gated potassium channel